MRYEGNKKVVVAVNLSDKPETVSIGVEGIGSKWNVLYGDSKPGMLNKDINITMPGYGIEVVRID